MRDAGRSRREAWILGRAEPAVSASQSLLFMPVSELGHLTPERSPASKSTVEWEGAFFVPDDLKALKQHLGIGQRSFQNLVGPGFRTNRPRSRLACGSGGGTAHPQLVNTNPYPV